MALNKSGGCSFGVLVAYEVARQLCTQGHRVALAALIDGDSPNNAAHTRSQIAFLLRRIQFYLDNVMELGFGDARMCGGQTRAEVSQACLESVPEFPQTPSTLARDTVPAGFTYCSLRSPRGSFDIKLMNKRRPPISLGPTRAG
jgi:hypothetical protein